MEQLNDTFEIDVALSSCDIPSAGQACLNFNHFFGLFSIPLFKFHVIFVMFVFTNLIFSYSMVQQFALSILRRF